MSRAVVQVRFPDGDEAWFRRAYRGDLGGVGRDLALILGGAGASPARHPETDLEYLVNLLDRSTGTLKGERVYTRCTAAEPGRLYEGDFWYTVSVESRPVDERRHTTVDLHARESGEWQRPTLRSAHPAMPHGLQPPFRPDVELMEAVNHTNGRHEMAKTFHDLDSLEGWAPSFDGEDDATEKPTP